MEYTIDLLISELNEYAKRPSPEELRITTITNVRHVFRKIGIECVANRKDEEIEIKKNKFSLPDRIVSVEDVGFDRHNYQGLLLAKGLAYNRELVCSKSPKELYFPNFSNGKIWIDIYEFYLDDFGSPIIPEAAYMACKHYCHSEIAFENAVSPIYQDRWILKQRAEQTIFSARSDFNTQSSASLRGIRNINA